MKHPKDDKFVCPGETVNLSVGVFSQTPFSCQWHLDKKPIPADHPDYEGSETSTLIIKAFQSKHMGTYKCVFTSEAYDSTTSCSIVLALGMLILLIDNILLYPAYSCMIAFESCLHVYSMTVCLNFIWYVQTYSGPYTCTYEGAPLTEAKVEALDKLLKDKGLALEDVGVSSEVLAPRSCGEVSATLENVRVSLYQKDLGYLADNLKGRLDESE